MRLSLQRTKTMIRMIVCCAAIGTSVQLLATAPHSDSVPYLVDRKPDKTIAADYCLDKSYRAAIDKTQKKIKEVRDEDLDYSSCTQFTCCCAQNIQSLFKKHTKDMTHVRLNPAVDALIRALRNQRIASDKKIQEIVYLKYTLSLYSFLDKDGTKMARKFIDIPYKIDGCEKFTFREPEKNRKEFYREGILKDTLEILHEWKRGVKMIEKKNIVKTVK